MDEFGRNSGGLESFPSSEWAVKCVIQEVGEPMDALCTNKSFDLLTVAGRSVIKMFALKNNGFEQVMDLRSKTKRMNLYFSGSISWNSVNENLLAATSSTGLIVLFDIENCKGNNGESIRFIDPEGPSSSEQFFRANKAAATKVCFHSYNPHLLISGSKDANIYLHDQRDARPAASFSVKGISIDSIRDLQFCLDETHQDLFVTGGDSGIVRFWDLRQPARYLKEFVGNTSSVGIALNPNLDQWNLLATVGRDGFIRVWDWSDKPETLYNIETPTNISRVEWCGTNIATTTNLHDHQLLIWNYNRPFFPITTFRGHESNISDMAFSQNLVNHKFVTCGKDRKLILHFTEHGDSIMRNTVPISMTSGPFNEIVTSYPKEYVNNNTVAELNYSRPVEPLLLQYPSSLLPVFNDPDTLIRLAQIYKFTGNNPVRLCNWNAYVNKRFGNFSLSYTWKAIGILIQQADIYKPAPATVPEDMYFEYDSGQPKHETIEKLDEEGDFSESDSEVSVESGAFCQNFQETLSLETDTFFNSEEFKMPGLLGGRRLMEFVQQKQDIQMEDELSLINEETMFKSSDGVEDESEMDSDLEETSISDQQLSSADDRDSNSDKQSTSSVFLSPIKSTILESESGESVSSEIGNSANDAKIENYFSVNLNGGSNNWGPLSILKRLINAYSDIGDSQTCATVCLILGKLAKQMFGEDQVSAWFFHYIEMLQDAGSNELATYMAKVCSCDEVTRVIQENMHVKFFCANCSIAAPSGMTYCPKCKIPFATVCTVCDHEVKGLFSQCNSCGHGGHFEHLEEWFKNFGICAFPGCMHVCVEAKQSESSQQKKPTTSDIDNQVYANRGLAPCGQNLFVDADDITYYRDEDGYIQRLPELVVDSSTQTKRKPNKYSLNP